MTDHTLNTTHDCGAIQISAADLELLDTTQAARYLKIKVARMRASLKAMGDTAEGMQIKVGDRAVIFACQRHPNPDCFMPGPFWRKSVVA
jgi:hypothetical protein